MGPSQNPFKSQQGELEYRQAYDAMMAYFPEPYETIDIPGSYGSTHLVVSGPPDAPALVLLHGGRASLTMWSRNLADLRQAHRVYAVDIIGQPGKSRANAKFQKRADLVPWFTELLDALHLARPNLVGQSYGGWFALAFALQRPERVNKLALISPAACFMPLSFQHMLQGARMFFFPSRAAMRSFKLWETYLPNLQCPQNRAFFEAKLEQLTLGFQHFRCQGEANPGIFSDQELRGLKAPTLLLIGEQEVIYNPVASIERAQRLVPTLEARLIPEASHDLAYFQARTVDELILKFLKEG